MTALAPIDGSTWGATISAIHRVEVGDLGGPIFIPKLKVIAWEESSFSIRYDVPEPGSAQQDGNGVKWQGTNRHTTYIDTDSAGGFVFKTILENNPAVGFIQHILALDDVEMIYQGPMTDMIGQYIGSQLVVSATETEAKNGAGVTIATRPEHIVGSYAVYKSNKKQTKTGGPVYGTNKIGHIYRPKITDSEDTSAWCTMQKLGVVLRITPPAGFLDSAVYPVEIK